jgi:cyclohexyl-isocyanide hydratase
MNLTVGFILFPDMTQLDLTGTFEVFARMPGLTIHLIWKTLDPVRADRGLMLIPTTIFEECPALDLVCVPGGPGQVALMEDQVVLRFLRQTASTCTATSLQSVPDRWCSGQQVC